MVNDFPLETSDHTLPVLRENVSANDAIAGETNVRTKSQSAPIKFGEPEFKSG